jgi:hypothetical protein
MCMGVGVPTVNRPSAEDNIHTGVCARACTYHATPGHRTGTAQGRRLTVSPVSADPSDRISNINLKCQWVLGVVVLFVGGWGYVMWATGCYDMPTAKDAIPQRAASLSWSVSCLSPQTLKCARTGHTGRPGSQSITDDSHRCARGAAQLKPVARCS